MQKLQGSRGLGFRMFHQILLVKASHRVRPDLAGGIDPTFDWSCCKILEPCSSGPQPPIWRCLAMHTGCLFQMAARRRVLGASFTPFWPDSPTTFP